MKPPIIQQTSSPRSLPSLIRAWKRLGSNLLCIAVFTTLMASSASAAGIVTTLPPLTGLVLMLDAEAEVHCLLPPGADAHDFQLTPRQAQSLKAADLLIRSSYDDGHWSGIGSDRRVFNLWPKQAHAWLSPRLVRDKLPALAAELQRLAPQRRVQIADSLTRAIKACDAADADWQNALAPYRESGAIMQHNAWVAVLQQYGVPVWTVLESGHHGDAIGPHRLEEALDLLRVHPGALLWGNQRHTSRALQWLQEHQTDRPQTQLLRFDPLGECGMPWPQLMQRNLDILTRAARP